MAVAPIGDDGKLDYHSVTVAYTGTDPKNANDTSSDIELFANGNGREHTQALGLANNNPQFRVDSQAESALKLAQRAQNISVKHGGSGKLTYTGHSLGGGLALFVAVRKGGIASVFVLRIHGSF